MMNTSDFRPDKEECGITATVVQITGHRYLSRKKLIKFIKKNLKNKGKYNLHYSVDWNNDCELTIKS